MLTVKSFLVVLLVIFMCGCGSAVDSGTSGETDGNTGTLDIEVGVGDGSLTLSWDPSSEAEGYKLYYGNISGNYTETVDVKNVETYSLTKLPSAEYYFAVTAYNSFGESTYSNEVSIEIP